MKGRGRTRHGEDLVVAFGGYNPLRVHPLLAIFPNLEYSPQTSARSCDQGILRLEVTTTTSQLYSQIYKLVCPFCVLRIYL